MASVSLKNPRRIFSQGTDSSLAARVIALEDNEIKITYFESVNSATGTITKPTNSTILLDQFPGGVDAFASTIANNQPTGEFPRTAGEVVVDVSSFDADGDYTLSGTPSAFPVAIVYVIKIKAVDYANLTLANIISEDRILDFADIEGNASDNSSLVSFVKNPRVLTVTSSASIALDIDLYDILYIPALATNLTGITITGTLSAFRPIIVVIVDNGTSRTLTFGSSFVAMGESLPTATTVSKVTTAAFLYYPSKSKLGCVGVKIEA